MPSQRPCVDDAPSSRPDLDDVRPASNDRFRRGPRRGARWPRCQARPSPRGRLGCSSVAAAAPPPASARSRRAVRTARRTGPRPTGRWTVDRDVLTRAVRAARPGAPSSKVLPVREPARGSSSVTRASAWNVGDVAADVLRRGVAEQCPSRTRSRPERMHRRPVRTHAVPTRWRSPEGGPLRLFAQGLPRPASARVMSRNTRTAPPTAPPPPGSGRRRRRSAARSRPGR